ncbi:MAG TPA: Uma2 family endonuclease [Planctomycetota bacterium]|nr:Uma2 family endonuclease [Planctomycetota bacterium]
MSVAARKRYSSADLWKFPEDGNRHEIIRGEWIMTPPPNVPHQTVVLNIQVLLANHVRPRRLGRVLGAPVAVILSEKDAVQPDVLFVSRERAARVRKDAVRGAPDLVVEVLSPSTAAVDRGRKLALYDKAGVREYWIVDPADRTVEIHQFLPTRRLRVFQKGQSFEPSVLPGLSVKVSEIFDSLR